MPRKATYPDWVNKYVQKGQYVNKINGKYYLYAAHSERKEGVPHPVRVCDGYIGRITQEDGLIKSRKRNTSAHKDPLPESASPKPDAWIFGLHYAVLSCTRSILSGLTKSYKDQGNLIYVRSILEVLHDTSSQSLYDMSILSFVFPNLIIPDDSSDIQVAVERGKRMVSDAIRKTYGDDWPMLQACLSASVVIRNTRGYKATEIRGYAPMLFKKYGLVLDTNTFTSLKQVAE